MNNNSNNNDAAAAAAADELTMKLKQAQTDLASLGRVSHRLAMIDNDDTAQLEKVLDKLLPRLLKRIGDNHRQQQKLSSSNTTLSSLLQQIQAKLMEMFSHILKRVRQDASCQLPCAAILELLVEVHAKEHDGESSSSVEIVRKKDVDSLTRNLSLTFLTLGVPRLCHCHFDETTQKTTAATNDEHAALFGKQQQKKKDQQETLAEHLLPSLLVLAADSSRLPAAAPSSTTTTTTSSSLLQQQQGAQWAHLLLHCIQGLALTKTTTRTPPPPIQNQPRSTKPISSVNTTSSSSSSATTTTTTTTIAAPTTAADPFAKARAVLACDEASIGRSIYDLFLDVLLYTPQPGDRSNTTSSAAAPPPPPPGLSQAGRDRIVGGPGPAQQGTVSEWNNHPTRLTLCKLAIVEAIAPSRRMALFLPNNNNKSLLPEKQSDPSQEIPTEIEKKKDLGLARTVALLVVASGSTAVANVVNGNHHYSAATSSSASGSGGGTSVAEQAKLYLKMHWDSYRGRGGLNATAMLGNDPGTLALELLTLCLGQGHADSILLMGSSSSSSDDNSNDDIVLGLGGGIDEAVSCTWTQQEILSTKRRAVSESMAAILMSFCANKIFEENLTLFSLQDQHHQQQQSANQQERQMLERICTLALTACAKTLTSSGVVTTNLSKNRAKPQLAASLLLQALTAPLSICYDNMNNGNMSIANSAADTTNADRTIALLLAKTANVSCQVLSAIINASSAASTTAATNTSAGGNDGSLAVRDHCYGVLCTLSRCRRFVLHPEGFLFSQGNQTMAAATSSMTQSFVVSTETAVLLFGCAAHEEERLRPRATAALDALLAAYCRVANVNASSNKDSNSSNALESSPSPASAPTAATAAPVAVESSNPWANIMNAPAEEDNTSLPANELATVDREMLARSLLPLLWMASQNHRPKASRAAAARWAGGLLKRLDLVRSFHLLSFLAGDSDTTVRGLANEGLGLSNKHIGIDMPLTGSSELPDFGDFVDIVFFFEENNSNSKLQNFWDFAFLGKAAALRVARVCLMNDIYGGEDKAVGIYLSTLAETLSFFAKQPSATSQSRNALDLLDEASTCTLMTLTTSQFARQQITSSTTEFGLRDMESLALSAHSSRARRHLAGACARLYEDASLWRKGDSPATSIVEWMDASGVDQVLELCSGRINEIHKSHAVVGQQHGIAYLAANVVRAFRLKSLSFPEKQSSENSYFDQCATIISALGRGCLHSDEVIGNACVDGVKISLSFDTLDSPPLDDRLAESTAKALSYLSKAIRKYGDGDHMDAPRVTRVIPSLGLCLGATATANVANLVELGAARAEAVKALFQLLGAVTRKDESIALLVGEALGQYADSDSCSTGEENIDWPEEYDEDFSNSLPPNEHVCFVLLKYYLTVSSPHKRTASAPVMLGLVGRAARGVNTDATYVNRPLVRTLLRHLDEVQTLFINILVDPKTKHLSRESCCLGLAACRGLAKAADNRNSAVNREAVDGMNHRILHAFGQTTQYGGSAFQETNVQAAQRRAAETDSRTASGSGIMEQFGVESEVGGAAGMGEASLRAYMEMAAASVSLGEPDILYALLILSASHTFWFEEGRGDLYSAASLLGEDNFIGNRTNSNQMREALRPHLGKLLPRVLRARHDPNPQTREQMTSLWLGLTGGGAASRHAITENFLSTFDVLIDDASSKLWRARVGALGALGEIIVGRDWIELGGGPPSLSDDDLYDGHLGSAGVRLLRLWRVVARAFDDVRGAVRDGAESLGRAVRALTIRLCDPSAQADKSSGEKRGREEQLQKERDASAAAATSVFWIVKHGLNQPVPEAAGLSISTLTEIVGLCRPKILEGVLPDLLRSLLTAVSSMEPAALNYLQLRVDNQEGLEQMRLRIIQSGPLATAVTKCLDLLPRSSIQTQQAVIPQLNTALRQSVGFATRAAVADAVSTLCGTCPAAFSFPGVSSTANPSVQLMRAFYFAAERERGQGSKDKMVHALGALAALCPGKSVRSLAARACNKYNTSTGNQDDPVSRRASASVIRAIAVRASGQLSDGGDGHSDIWTRLVLPVAFLGQHDPDKKIASYFVEVWDEGGSQGNLSHKCGTKLEEKLLPELTKECVRALQDVSWSRRVAGAKALMELCTLGVLSPVPRSTTSMMESSDALRSRRRAKSSNIAIQECIRLLTKPRLWTGKSVIVETTVKIVQAWVAAESDIDSDDRVLYGWEGAKGACPFQPVYLSKEITDDLFVGDQWFTTTLMETDDDEVAEDPETLVPLDSEKEAKEDSNGGIIIEETDKEDEEVDNGKDAMVVEEAFQVVTFAGLCRLLVMEALPENRNQATLSMSEEYLPYRTRALHSFRDLMNSLPPNNSDQRVLVYQEVANRFISTFQNQPSASETKKEPPVVVAAAIESLGACFWEGFGSTAVDGVDVDPSDLCTMLQTIGGSEQPAWTVRQAAPLGLAQLARTCDEKVLRRPRVISTMMESASYALKDRKFWRVRHAGLLLLKNLVQRTGSSSSDRNQLLLEALLPYKEETIRLLRKSLADSEPKVTAVSSEILTKLAWWP